MQTVSGPVYSFLFCLRLGFMSELHTVDKHVSIIRSRDASMSFEEFAHECNV